MKISSNFDEIINIMTFFVINIYFKHKFMSSYVNSVFFSLNFVEKEVKMLFLSFLREQHYHAFPCFFDKTPKKQLFLEK